MSRTHAFLSHLSAAERDYVLRHCNSAAPLSQQQIDAYNSLRSSATRARAFRGRTSIPFASAA